MHGDKHHVNRLNRLILSSFKENSKKKKGRGSRGSGVLRRVR